MPFSLKEIELRKAIQEEYDFFEHCKSCPTDIHCCTRDQNVVIVREEEKEYLEEAFEMLKQSEGLAEEDRLVFAQIERDVDLFRLEAKNGQCPMFTAEGKCFVHPNKPLDCLLWPTMFAIDKENGPIALDVKCPATRSAAIPPTFYQIEKPIKELLPLPKRTIYARENLNSYKAGRIVDVEALGPARAQQLLFQWDNIKKPIEENIDRIWKRLASKLDLLRYDSEDVLSVFKWILAISIALCLEYSFKLSYDVFLENTQVLSEIRSNYLYSFIFTNFEMTAAAKFIDRNLSFVEDVRIFACAALVLFLFDAFRLLVPLPWIFKSFRKRKATASEHPKPFRLPAYDVTKLAIISVLTIYVFFFAAQKFVLLNVYFLCIAVAQFLDVFWYLPPLKKFRRLEDPRIAIDSALEEIKQCESQLDQELAKLVVDERNNITTTLGSQQTSAVERANDAIQNLGNVLKHEKNELETGNARRAKRFKGDDPMLKAKWEEYLETKTKIENETKSRSRWSRIAVWDFFSCLAVISPVLPLISRLPTWFLLSLVVGGIASHIANITYDYWKNHDEYYSMLTLLYRPGVPLTQSVDDSTCAEAGVPLKETVDA